MSKCQRKVPALVLSICLLILLVGCSISPADKPQTPPPNEPPVTTNQTLTVGSPTFSGTFSPFFSRTAQDCEIADIVSVPLLDTDREGRVILQGITGETIPYDGTDYTYHGIADCTATETDDGRVIYDFILRDDICFSDNEPLTADDVIFSMYVLADPSYDGTAAFATLPIQGLAAYRSGVNEEIYETYAALADRIWAAGPEAAQYDGFTEAQYTAYWGDVLAAAGDLFVSEIVDYCLANYSSYLPNCGNNEVALAMYAWGYGTLNEDGSLTASNGKVYDPAASFPTKADFWQLILDAHNRDFSENGIDRDAVTTPIAACLKRAFISIEGPKDEAAGGPVTAISGIEKRGEHAVRVTMTAPDATAVYHLGIAVAPLHYYGAEEMYDYAANRFGFPKGDLSAVKAKSAAPLGAGAFTFQSYADGTVTLQANKTYYKGCPQIETLLFRETTATACLAGIVDGTLDVTLPDLSANAVNTIRQANNGTLSGDVITTAAVDPCNYGYLGIHADHVKVGKDAASDASKNLRKAFATLFAVYREQAIAAYYGERAGVIEYPIPVTSWAAPQSTDEGFAAAFTSDANGNPIYSADMTVEEKYAAALAAATDYFKAAGYIWDEETAKFVAAPVGAKLSYDFLIAAEGTGNHPHFAVVTAAKEALETIGITLTIVDLTDVNRLWAAVGNGTCAMWSATRSCSPDPDMYPVYHSSNILGKGGNNANLFAIADSELDRLLTEARTATDHTFRKQIYKNCMDIVLDWGVEIPVYPCQNAVIFRTARINAQTVTPHITAFWSWTRDIEKLEMN